MKICEYGTQLIQRTTFNVYHLHCSFICTSQNIYIMYMAAIHKLNLYGFVLFMGWSLFNGGRGGVNMERVLIFIEINGSMGRGGVL